MTQKNPSPKQEEEEVPYLGNIWGWNLTYKMLIFLVAMLLLVGFRSWYLGVNPFIPPAETVPVVETDSLMRN